MPQPKASVLIADDEQDTVQVLKDVLGEEGYVVKGALDGQEALRMVKSEPPDILVLDLKIPGLDGERMLEQIWADELAPHMKVIILTGFNDFDRTKERILLRYGSRVSAYIEKPIDIGAFQKMLADCAPQGRGGA